ncbi:uncharacterized protein LOC105184779 isoform X2 [Harpegnathos saltator]|nr:uncharacterized protein LOC105184779 isoform X2 [Harpegnathos saltator]
MRLYAVALVTWTIIVTASLESSIADFSDKKAIGYTEFRDSPVKQIVQPYVTLSPEERGSRQIGTEDHSNDAAGLSRPVTRAESASRSNSVSTIDSASLAESAYSTPLTETADRYPFRESPGGESGYAIPEDVLLVESAGAFGQRVRQGPAGEQTTGRVLVKINDGQQNDEYVSFRKSISSTLQSRGVPPFNQEDNQRKIYTSTTRKPSVLTSKQENELFDTSPSDESEKTIGFDLSIKSLDENSRFRSSTESSSSAMNGPVFENDVIPEHLPKPQGRSSRTHNATEDTLKKAVVPTEEPESVSTTTSVEIRPSIQLTKFSGPIVVPDLPMPEEQDAIIDYMDEDSSSESLRPLEDIASVSETNVRSSKVTTSNSIMTSSLMLNPLQVGITLVNDVKTDLVDDSELSAATETKDYFRDDLQQRPSSEGFAENKGNHSDIKYKDENVQYAEGKRTIEAVTQRAPDNSVEIQKSVELYHTAPVHEIHYPVEYIQQTTHLGVIETNSIGNAPRSRQPYEQDEHSESQLNYDTYRGNDAAIEKSVIKGQAASALPQKFHRQEYNILENDVGKPTASALVTKYTSSTHERVPVDSLESQPLQYNEARPVLLIANQFNDALYEQSNAHHTINSNDNDPALHTRLHESPTRHETTGEFVRPYVTTAASYREQQLPSADQSINQQHLFHLQTQTSRPQEQPTQLLLKIIPNGSPVNAGFLVPIPRPYPIEKIVEKTVHVPHPVEIEKVIEKKVQIPVPVPVPQPYPVHIPVNRLVEKQVRVPQLYPIHIERTLEKRIPYTVQRLLLQPPAPYPLHLKSPVTYPAQVGSPIEQPTQVTSTSIEQVAEKSLAGLSRPPRPYPTDADRDDPIEIKYKYQQRPIFGGENIDPGYDSNVAFESGQSNATQLYGNLYDRSPLVYDHGLLDHGKYHVPAAAHLSGNVRLMMVPKKFGAHHTVLLRPHASASSYTIPSVSFRRQIVYNLVEKDKAVKDEYIGPLPPRKAFVSQAKQLPPAVKPSSYSTSVTQSPVTTIGGPRRTRQPEAQYPNSFRQSKMEYGFKPPMVPSVQYDEKTASKVEK